MALWDPVGVAGRGERSDYALSHRPHSREGGQADVYAAEHKPTGLTVAFKKLRHAGPDELARMKREVEIGRSLGSNRHVMPVLDASVKGDWMVMPFAVGNVEAFRTELAKDEGRLRRFVVAVCAGLREAHEHGWVHRDVKPGNLLRLEDGGKKWWVVADWGLGRRPRGQTSLPGRTRVGQLYGTEGFAAPELSVDAHAATASADIYSLAQVIGWILTGSDPQPNVPLLPSTGPWRGVIRAATKFEPSRRPQSIDALLEIIESELDDVPEDAIGEAERLVTASGTGNRAAAARVFQLAANDVHDYDLHIDVLPRLSATAVRDAVAADTDAAETVARSFIDHLQGDWGHRSFGWADSVIELLLHIAEAATHLKADALLEDAANALFAWDGSWDQWNPQPAIRRWLAGLSGEEARIVAAVLRRHRDAAGHFAEVADNRRADPRVRDAIRR